jgi:FMN phosphatase YigB (HAD superfamily)
VIAMTTIETVIFDLGGVLVEIELERMTWPLAELAGATTDEVVAALRAGHATLEAYERGQLTSAELHRWLLDALGLPADRCPFELFRRHMCAVIVPSPEMAALFRRTCAAPACTTCILSNTNDLHWTCVAERFDLLQHADHTLTSYETGFYKPEPEIYHLALERFGVIDPATAIFIDDQLPNVEAAVQAGMIASFPHQDARTTRRRLVELGVLEAGTGYS